MYTIVNSASPRSAARFLYTNKKEGWEISWENQIGPVLAVECIPQGKVVLNYIFIYIQTI